MLNNKSILCFIFIFLLVSSNIKNSEQGPLSGAICSAGCAAIVVACYSAAGAVFGTITAGAGTPPAILACNAAFAKCMAACAAGMLFYIKWKY